MSRAMTTAQVIGLGEYLNPEFDPATLTVAQLLGVLGYHNIRFPTPYTKPKLVQLFLDEVKPKAAKFKKDRLKKENSAASDDGITDGMTGKPLSGATKPRRSSRRLSHAPSDDDEPPPRPDPPKRRRSSAQPSLGGAHKTIARAAVQPAVIEESEPEEEDPPLRKVGRNKKSSRAAGSQARRISLADDSGWEDNNIFQSGAESSSPARPSPMRPQSARKSGSVKKSRHSMSAPPQASPSLSPPKALLFPVDLQRSPPQSKFEPELPPTISRAPRISTPSETVRFSPIEHLSRPRPPLTSKVNALDFDDATDVVDGQTPDESQSDSFGEPDSLEVAVSNRIAGGDQLVRRRPAPPLQRSRSRLLTILYLIVMVAGSYFVKQYKDESSLIGYCDTGNNTNQVLRDLVTQREAVQACNKDNKTVLYLPSVISDTGLFEDGIPCPFPPFVPALYPSTCAPCPEFATCTRHSVVCNPGYVSRPHPLLGIISPFGTATPLVESIWSLIGNVTNGLPGLGPVAFPPRCSEDPKRKRNIGALGKAIEVLLGRVIDNDSEGGEAMKWGLEIEMLRNTMKRKTAPHLLANFDDTFNEAIQQLVQWGSVIFGEDSTGNRYLAHKTPHLTLNCQFTVKSRELWEQWRASVYASIACVLALYFIKRSRALRHIEGRRVAELVQIALDTLRNQELAHHTDPVTAPQPYLSSLQLRDLILQDEHSISARRRLWDQVERVVEGNANVRANLEEVQGGDELRVWRWVGSTGGPEIRKVQFQTQKDEVNTNAL
ncbi:Man1-Src1p-C-terminal domain-containing protein [Suillus subalutaceus]|uniref:Man1-Src1p-C-terminal domain-containing protein n=1 Tax=Suillus subalutaceus TaxID=48586 RepID=UPI001B85BFC6|nr:Man1-Src1p-C-terminal domain-containing protein [Suillus subalutaceus]KAG1853685.1 Man1-Src1p-C-terminal domain-containing protein [Suillus subalutaceus]